MAKRSKNAVPKDETKRDKFKRIVELRVRKALKAITLVGNCASPAYEYNADDIAAIVGALQCAIEQLDTAYRSKGVQRIDFNLD